MKLLTQFYSKSLHLVNAKKESLIYPVLLFFLCLTLIIVNRTPDTYLSGWDTLHPEFNFPLNFQRMIFGVFREEQGLGAVAAHAHMADLPRVFLLWVSSFIFPVYFLRYFLISICLPIGVLGVYFFCKDIVFSKNKDSRHFSFISSLFYLFNLGTLQHFYVPFEMFTVGYAVIPWLFWSVSNYLSQNNKKNLLILSIITLFASPMAYAPILWYVYFASLVLFLLPFCKSKLPQVIKIISLTLLINTFWILPNLYFLFSGAAALVPDARINKIFSEEAYTFNKSFGSIQDALIFKNFLFDWPVFEGRDAFGFLLGNWRGFVNSSVIIFLGYLFSAIYLIGLVISYKSKNMYLKSLLLPFALTFVFLINSTWPVSGIFDFLRDNSSLFREALRFPFTKFSLIFMFICSVLFGCGLYFVKEFLAVNFSRLNKKISLSVVTISIFLVLFIIYTFPFFKGDLISKKMQVKIPQEYFQVFDYLNSQTDEGRVAIFPVHTFWGWIYYGWGFQGAQFVSFGIKQPVMDRDYDRWNPRNEQYYREISYAVYTHDLAAFQNVLDKYQIKFLIVDENIIAPGPTQDAKVLYIPEIRSLLRELESQSNQIKLAKKFSSIEIYEYKKTFSNISQISNLQTVSFNKGFFDTDIPYALSGGYLNTVDSNSKLPFWPFHDNQNIVNQNIVTTSQNQIILKTKLNSINEIDSSRYKDYEDIVPAKLYASQDSKGINLSFRILLSELPQELNYTIPYTIRSDERLIINIDEIQTIELHDLTTEQIFQKDVLLNLKNFNNLAFYRSSQEKVVSYNPSIIKSEPTFNSQNIIEENSILKLCSKSDKDQVFGYDATDVKNIKIASKNSQTCLWIPLEKVLEQTGLSEFKDLLSYSFSTQTSTNIFGRVCIFDKSARRCLKEQKYITNQDNFKDFFPINSEDIGRLDLVLYLDGINNQKLETMDYQNLTFRLNKPIGFLTINPDEISAKIATQTILKSNEDGFKIFFGENWSGLNTDLLEPFHKSDNCGNNSTKKYERVINEKEKFLEFRTFSGSNCDFFSYSLAPHNIGYLVEIQAQNIKGLSLRVCIAINFSRRCEAYLSLPKSEKMEKYLISVPPTKDGGVGIDIHFDNYSVGNFETINRVGEIKVTPFPYKFITTLITGDLNQNLIHPIENKSLKSSMILPFIYKIDTVEAISEGYITFNQAFVKGWIMLGGESHLEFNGWANAYKIGNNKSFWLIYIPEVFELIGFAILLGLISWQILYFNLSSIFWKVLYFNDYWIRKVLFLKPLRPFNK